MNEAQMDRTTTMMTVIFLGLGPHMLCQLHSNTSRSDKGRPESSIVRQLLAAVICIETTSSCWGICVECLGSRLEAASAVEAAIGRSEGLMMCGLVRVPFEMQWLGEECNEAVAAERG